jgi:tetratricopeptide (TPR) repeat protein
VIGSVFSRDGAGSRASAGRSSRIIAWLPRPANTAGGDALRARGVSGRSGSRARPYIVGSIIPATDHPRRWGRPYRAHECLVKEREHGKRRAHNGAIEGVLCAFKVQGGPLIFVARAGCHDRPMRRIFDPMFLMRSTVEMGRNHEDRAHAQVVALGRLADALDAQDEAEEALTLSREAVTLILRLRPRKRKKYARDLAAAFDGHAERLRAGGGLEEAVAARQEAIAIREEWLAPGDWLEVSLMGASRWQLAEDQLALGRHDDAVATLERSLADWNAIVDRGAQYVRAVGRSHILRARGLAAAGRWEAALGAADEAVAIFRAHGGGPDLAAALIRRAAVLTAMERFAEALVATEEAIPEVGSEAQTLDRVQANGGAGRASRPPITAENLGGDPHKPGQGPGGC